MEVDRAVADRAAAGQRHGRFAGRANIGPSTRIEARILRNHVIGRDGRGDLACAQRHLRRPYSPFLTPAILVERRAVEQSEKLSTSATAADCRSRAFRSKQSARPAGSARCLGPRIGTCLKAFAADDVMDQGGCARGAVAGEPLPRAHPEPVEGSSPVDRPSTSSGGARFELSPTIRKLASPACTAAGAGSPRKSINRLTWSRRLRK